jgi:ribonuclease VapC
MDMIFIDTSALVAMLASEPDGVRVAAAIEAALARKIIAPVRLEAAMVLASRLAINPEAADEALSAALSAARIEVVPVDDAMAKAAVRTFFRYGKSRGHPARLNLLDCMVYAAARRTSTPLLFIGEDYSQTDIESVLADPRPLG